MVISPTARPASGRAHGPAGSYNHLAVPPPPTPLQLRGTVVRIGEEGVSPGRTGPVDGRDAGRTQRLGHHPQMRGGDGPRHGGSATRRPLFHADPTGADRRWTLPRGPEMLTWNAELVGCSCRGAIVADDTQWVYTTAFSSISDLHVNHLLDNGNTHEGKTDSAPDIWPLYDTRITPGKPASPRIGTPQQDLCYSPEAGEWGSTPWSGVAWPVWGRRSNPKGRDPSP